MYFLKQSRWLFSSLLILSLLLVPSLQSFATAPTYIVPASDTDTSDYHFLLTSYSQYVFVSANIYADNWYIHNNHVNFTNSALTAASNPTQSFGIGADDGNATITEIATGQVKVTMSCTSGANCDAYFYHSPLSRVYAVTATIAGTDTTIQSAQYTTDSTFAGLTLPAVYTNSASGYIQVRLTYSSPTTITFFLNQADSGGGGGGGSGGGSDSGSGGGTGGGSGGGSSGTVLNVTVTMPEFTIAPGSSQTKNMTIFGSGYTRVIITEIAFDSRYANWIALHSGGFPIAITLQPGEMQLKREIPVQITVPEGTDFQSILITSKVVARIDGSSATEIIVPIKLNVGTPLGLPSLGNDVIAALVVAVVAAVALVQVAKQKKRR